MNLLIVFFLVTFMWQNARAEYNANCTLNNNFMGRCVPYASCKSIEKQNSRRNKSRHPDCGTFNGINHVCCANDQIQFNAESMNALETFKCGKVSTAPKIFNGDEVRPWTRPWMAILIYNTEVYQDILCGGTLISHYHVLTAAHCVSDDLEKVRLGSHDRSNKKYCVAYNRFKTKCHEAEDFDIDKPFIHEGYHGSKRYNDIALLRLRDYVNFDDHIAPICLPIPKFMKNNIKAYKSWHITGWGRTENGTTSNVLRKADVHKVNLKKCSILHRIQWQDSQICAKGNNTDSCKGDSGGPLQEIGKYKNTRSIIQIGLVYRGKKCSDNQLKLPSIYTNVSSYLQWISDKMQISN